MSKAPRIRDTTLLAALLLGTCGISESDAFSLLGPYDSWMTPQLGFAQPGDIGGPMNLGQEYRWNVPVLTYAFDAGFLDYFGSNGVAAVEAAVDILNNLPPVSALNVSNYALQATYVNYNAQAQGLYDLKSQTLALLLEQLGLTAPTRFTYCLRNFALVNGVPQATVEQRNYDPYSWSQSDQVNGVACGYELRYFGDPPTNADAVEFALDPSQNELSAVAEKALSAGSLYSELTRDDIAGLRYLLHTNNINYEPLLPDVHGAGTNSSSWVTQAARPGVDKLLFVRPDGYGLFTGRFAVPYTNQFIDTYVANGLKLHQQLERVVTQPDVLFSSADLSTGVGPAPRFTRTGTTNWLATPGAAGPGIIQPGVQITFHRPGFHIQTADSRSGADVLIQDFEDYRWGSFDHSSTPPTAYPAGFVPATNLTVEMELDSAILPSPALCTWTVPVPAGGSAALQTSTNLSDWTTLLSVVNRGVPLQWRHAVGQPQRFFRVIAQ